MATQLPTVEIQGVTYFIDNRLGQLRAVDNPHNTHSVDDLSDDEYDQMQSALGVE